MRLSKDLCFGNRAQKYIPYLMENLREGHIVPMAYLVYSGYGSNLFEFYSSSMLKMKNFPRKGDEILGIAYGYKDALQLVSMMSLKKLRGEEKCSSL